jgi:hypothetical protein
MIADALAENSSMRGLATRAGYTIKAIPHDYEAVKLEKTLAGLASRPPGRLAA